MDHETLNRWLASLALVLGIVALLVFLSGAAQFKRQMKAEYGPGGEDGL